MKRSSTTFTCSCDCYNRMAKKLMTRVAIFQKRSRRNRHFMPEGLFCQYILYFSCDSCEQQQKVQSRIQHLNIVRRQTGKWVCRLWPSSRPFLFKPHISDHQTVRLRGETSSVLKRREEDNVSAGLTIINYSHTCTLEPEINTQWTSMSTPHRAEHTVRTHAATEAWRVSFFNTCSNVVPFI